MDVKVMVGLAFAIFFFTIYFVEEKMKKEQIFWSYALLGVIFGIISAISVAKDSPNAGDYIAFATISVLISIFYFESSGEEPEKKMVRKKKTKKGRAK
jgi:uncharacterized membrane protein YjfL (UPF0719 family)